MAFHVLRVVLGLFLLSTAGLKLHALLVDSVSYESLFASPRIQIATIQFEFLLGIWLLSGGWVRTAWLVLLGFFSILASASLYLALGGQTNCGCFGKVSVHPWATFIMDVAVLVALCVCRPKPWVACQDRWTSGVSFVAKVVAGAAALLLLFGSILLAADRPTDILARLRGEVLTVDPNVSDVGEAMAGVRRWFTVHLVNHTDRPIRVVGGTTSCSCIAARDLPVVVPPHASRPIVVQISYSGGVGRFYHRFVLYTDDEQQRLVVARFTGGVVGRPPTP